jgi:hypothetical protein
MRSTRLNGVVAVFVTGLVLVATSPPPRGRNDSLTVQFDGGCGAGASVITSDDNNCGGSVSNLLGQDGWVIESRSTCTAPVRDESFSFVSARQSQVDGGIPTADGGTRLVQPQDDLQIRCTATPDDAGLALECTWNICAPQSTVQCVTEPRCSGRFSPVP